MIVAGLFASQCRNIDALVVPFVNEGACGSPSTLGMRYQRLVAGPIWRAYTKTRCMALQQSQ